MRGFCAVVLLLQLLQGSSCSFALHKTRLYAMLAAVRVAALLVVRCSAWHAAPVRHAHALRATSDAEHASVASTTSTPVPAVTLAALRVPDLKDICRALGLKVGGTKAALIERILEVDAGAAQVDASINADGADADAAQANASINDVAAEAQANSWELLGLDDSLRERLSHAQPTPIQAAAFEALSSGADAVLHAETGSGKTLAYALPLANRRVLVLTPSTALADQIGGVIDALLPENAFAVHTAKEVLAAQEDLDGIDCIVLDEVDSLLRVPGRYADAEQKKHRRERPAAKILRRLIQKRPDAQVVAASATVGRPLRRHMDDILRTASQPTPDQLGGRAPSHVRTPLRVLRGVALPVSGRAVTAPATLRHVVCPFWDQGPGQPAFDALKTALEALDAANPLVIVNTGDPDPVSRYLAQHGFADVVVFAPNEVRGLDPEGVDVVLSLGRPKTCDDYLHVAGRTGRAGKDGLCVTVAPHRDAKAVAAFASPLGLDFVTLAETNGLWAYRRGA